MYAKIISKNDYWIHIEYILNKASCFCKQNSVNLDFQNRLPPNFTRSLLTFRKERRNLDVRTAKNKLLIACFHENRIPKNKVLSRILWWTSRIKFKNDTFISVHGTYDRKEYQSHLHFCDGKTFLPKIYWCTYISTFGWFWQHFNMFGNNIPLATSLFSLKVCQHIPSRLQKQTRCNKLSRMRPHSKIELVDIAQSFA